MSVLLQVFDEVLPAGSHHWEKVSLLCREAKKGMYRTGVPCKSKFEKLAFANCPTGTADIPIHILQAKELEEEISGHEMIGFVSENGPEFEHDDEYDSTNLLSSSKSNDSGTEVKRPATKKQKTTQMAEAVKVLSAGTYKAAELVGKSKSSSVQRYSSYG